MKILYDEKGEFINLGMWLINEKDNNSLLEDYNFGVPDPPFSTVAVHKIWPADGKEQFIGNVIGDTFHPRPEIKNKSIFWKLIMAFREYEESFTKIVSIDTYDGPR